MKTDDATFFVYPTPLGRVSIASDGSAIIRVAFGAQQLEGSYRASTLTNEVANQLQEYLAGKRSSFDVPLAPRGSAFQLKVWDALSTIPYGQTRTYREVAAMVGNPSALRAVGGANNKNPLPLLLPCHRVIGAHGDPVGYVADLKIKRFLLELEAHHT